MPEYITILSKTQNSQATNSAAHIAVQEGRNMHNYFDDFQNMPVQYKLTVGAVDNSLEREADAIADTVMLMPEQSFIQRKCAYCEEEEIAHRKALTSFIQKKEVDGSSAASDTIANHIQSTKGSGNLINETTKSFMESRFGTDFSNVRIHADNNAAQLSNQLNAQAFTFGNDIFFNEGKYKPQYDTGKYLLAHELTHVIQQQRANNSVQKKEFKSTGRANEETPELINDTVIKSSLLAKYVGADRIKAAFLDSKNFHVIQHYELEEFGKKCKQGDIVDKAGGFFCRDVANAKDKDLRGDIFAVRYLKLGYVIHEFIHKLSGVMAKNMLGTFVNEGITQYFADQFLNEGRYEILTDHGYMDNLTCANKIVSQTNKDTVADTYFNNKIKLVDDLQKKLHLGAITDVKPYLDQHQCIP